MAGTAPVASKGRRGGMIVGINVTPMVDVVLVLLVIMMVSATYIVSQSMKVDLPSTKTSDGSASSVAAVTISKDKAIYFNQKPVEGDDALAREIKAAAGGKTDLTLIVTADRDAPHGVVVHVMDVARDVGIKSFAVNVDKRN
jgi:biopolymer transport protein ExbD